MLVPALTQLPVAARRLNKLVNNKLGCDSLLLLIDAIVELKLARAAIRVRAQRCRIKRRLELLCWRPAVLIASHADGLQAVRAANVLQVAVDARALLELLHANRQVTLQDVLQVVYGWSLPGPRRQIRDVIVAI